MAKKQTSKKPVQKTEKKSYDVFTDPTESIWGKIVVGIILFGTIAVILIGAGIAIYDFFK
ncbi:hypothetical protein JV173_01670 [Acholeplasma equirhinis]|uniref:hypothetical protein n=1 Tax=Acholeplasma equirhinis TaxID=555393 RepID=UPI00197AC96D|nr:hypothetical protein [Acholeplasma equirhinis]MBN3490213.1 hypothetical protein [Acholeplasma equirhinis]